MPSKYPVTTPKDVIRVLQKRGYTEISQKGSHKKFYDGRHVVILPMHSEVAKGTLKSILKQADMTVEELIEEMR